MPRLAPARAFRPPHTLCHFIRPSGLIRIGGGRSAFLFASVQSWIAERLSMRSAGNVSEQVRMFAKRPEKDLSKEIRKWKTKNQ